MMKKRLLMGILTAVFGAMTNPGILMAADFTFLLQPDFAGDAETVEETEDVEPTSNTATSVALTAKTSTEVDPKPAPAPTPAPTSAKPVYTEPTNNIKIAGKTLEVVQVANTTEDAGGHVNQYGDKFLYGHNSAAVFGALTQVGVGATFTVTKNGVTTNYRVEKVVIFEKNVSNGRLQLDGEGSYMNSVAKAKFNGTQYDLSIMTCYGTSYGNSDASHRYVIFARAF